MFPSRRRYRHRRRCTPNWRHFCVHGESHFSQVVAHIDVSKYLVARVITGLGMGSIFTVVPVWTGEIAPPRYRGVMAGMHGCFINVGYFSANWVG